MALVTRFEDLHAWQQARRLASLTYQATRELRFARDRGLVDQIRRAATSTVTNIAEGFGSGSTAEFRRVLRYAIGSAVEVQSVLYIAVDQQYLDDRHFRELFESAERVKSLSSALLRRLSRRAGLNQFGNGRISEGAPRWLAERPCCVDGQTTHVSTSARQYVSTRTGSLD